MSCEGRPGTTFATLGEIRAPGQWKRVGRRCSPSGVLKLVVNPSYRKIMSLEAGRGTPPPNSSLDCEIYSTKVPNPVRCRSENNIRRWKRVGPRCSSSGVLKLVVSPSYRSTSWLEAGRGAPRANSSQIVKFLTLIGVSPELPAEVPDTCGLGLRLIAWKIRQFARQYAHDVGGRAPTHIVNGGTG